MALAIDKKSLGLGKEPNCFTLFIFIHQKMVEVVQL